MERWHRHLEGWQLAVVAVGVAVTSMVLVLPRAVVPREIPLPAVDREELTLAAKKREALADSARREPLPLLVRAVGEAVRAFGEAESRGDVAAYEARARDVVMRGAEARKALGNGPLLVLRAVQTELFVRAATTWARTGVQEPDVQELGGAFVRRARRNEWLRGRRLVISEEGLAHMFALRWTRLAGLSDTQPFIATLNDLRFYYRTLMQHPDARVNDAYAEAEAQGGYVTALEKVDPDYPAALASGIVAFRKGEFDDAAELLAAHLKDNPGGPWRLRAQNYWVAARDRRLPAPGDDGF